MSSNGTLMICANRRGSRRTWLAMGALCTIVAAPPGFSQAQGEPARTARETTHSEADPTGYWVALITEDWRWRMVTPPKGDYASVPINIDGKRTADTWDPARDEAAGEQCRSHGAPGIMRAPTRLHITWDDEDTLKVETDYGQQTRLLHFGDWEPSGGPATWQGDTTAAWKMARSEGESQTAPRYGSIESVTTNLRPGYLRKNGIPYSADTALTEFWNVHKERDGSQLLVVTVIVHDPAYLERDWITAQHFKREADGSKWDPQPCNARW